MEELSLRDMLAIFKRQKKYFFLVFTILFALSLFFALNWANYRSEATVKIEQSTIASNVTLLSGQSQNEAITALADQRISKIEQTVTSLASLSEIIAKFNLYPGLRDKVPTASITDMMRKKIRLDFVSSVIANPAAAQKQSVEQLSAIAFKLSFDYSNPQTAQQVADELVTRFLNEDLKLRRTQAEETSSFLKAQLEALEASMNEQEKKISDFRAKHGESGPAALMFNQQTASTTRFNLQNVESQILANEGTQGSLRAQLATIDPYSRVIADGQVLTTPTVQLKALEAQYATLTGQYGPNHPDVVKTRNQIKVLKAQVGKDRGGNSAQLKAQIADLHTNLAAAEKTNGPKHPDVLALKRQLESLEEKLAAEPESGSSGIKRDADNPAYLQIVAQLSSAQEQYKALQAQRDALKVEQMKSDQALAANPQVEEQMSKLTRDYENAQLRYRELKEKKLAADMNEELEENRKGQRLIVINPPSLPAGTQPRRLLLLIGSFLLSVIGGLGTVVLAESMNRNVHGSVHLTSLVGAAPLVIIPQIYTVNGKRSPRQVILRNFKDSLRWALQIIFLPVFATIKALSRTMKSSETE